MKAGKLQPSGHGHGVKTDAGTDRPSHREASNAAEHSGGSGVANDRSEHGQWKADQIIGVHIQACALRSATFDQSSIAPLASPLGAGESRFAVTAPR